MLRQALLSRVVISYTEIWSLLRVLVSLSCCQVTDALRKKQLIASYVLQHFLIIIMRHF